jgi:glycosyltransferase involved in cell wall biosynthesis
VGEPHPKKREFLGEVKATIQAAKLENEITLAGHRSDLREIMAVSDVVVSCSTDPEAFGRVTLEALSLGRPVAGYGHGGVAEQLQALLPQGLVPVGDVAAMITLLESFRRNPTPPENEPCFTLVNMLSRTLELYGRDRQDEAEMTKAPFDGTP